MRHGRPAGPDDGTSGGEATVLSSACQGFRVVVLQHPLPGGPLSQTSGRALAFGQATGQAGTASGQAARPALDAPGMFPPGLLSCTSGHSAYSPGTVLSSHTLPQRFAPW